MYCRNNSTVVGSAKSLLLHHSWHFFTVASITDYNMILKGNKINKTMLMAKLNNFFLHLILNIKLCQPQTVTALGFVSPVTFARAENPSGQAHGIRCALPSCSRCYTPHHNSSLRASHRRSKLHKKDQAWISANHLAGE